MSEFHRHQYVRVQDTYGHNARFFSQNRIDQANFSNSVFDNGVNRVCDEVKLHCKSSINSTQIK